MIPETLGPRNGRCEMWWGRLEMFFATGFPSELESKSWRCDIVAEESEGESKDVEIMLELSGSTTGQLRVKVMTFKWDQSVDVYVSIGGLEGQWLHEGNESRSSRWEDQLGRHLRVGDRIHASLFSPLYHTQLNWPPYHSSFNSALHCGPSRKRSQAPQASLTTPPICSYNSLCLLFMIHSSSWIIHLTRHTRLGCKGLEGTIWWFHGQGCGWK